MICTNPADMDHCAGAAFFSMLLSRVVTDPLLWGGRSGQWSWSRNAAMPYGCLAANDKATAQKQMTENLRQQCEVFAKYGRQTQSCHQLPAADTGVPLQLFAPTIRLGFTLAFISLCGIMIFFFDKAQSERAKMIRIWWTESSIWNCMSCRVAAVLLHIVSQHNRLQEIEVNTRRKKHTERKGKGKIVTQKGFPTATI